MVDCTTNLQLNVFWKVKLCSRLWMVFIQNFCETWHIWVSEPHFGEVRGHARPWLMARWKAHHQLSIACYVNFLLSIAVPELRGKMCIARLFSQGVELFALKFYLDMVVPHQPFLASEPKDTEILDDEDHIPLCFVVLTQYWSVSVMDGQTYLL